MQSSPPPPTRDVDEKLQILRRYLAQRSLKVTRQRMAIARAFFEMEGHISAEDLYEAVRGNDGRIGLATVYRCLHLLCDCGLAQERRFEGGIVRYEQLYGRKHHDHLICSQCGRIVEVGDLFLDQLQLDMLREHNFLVEGHRLELYGICGRCREAVS